MKSALSTALAAILALSALSGTASAQPVPCEDMLKTLREAEASVKIDDATKAKVAALEAKGVERCNADDDKRADAFFADALKLLGK